MADEKKPAETAVSQTTQTAAKQESAATTEASAESQTQSVAPDSAAPAAPASSSGNVTIDFKDADIQNVLRILSYKSGVNIVAGKDVTGIVTIRRVS